MDELKQSMIHFLEKLIEGDDMKIFDILGKWNNIYKGAAKDEKISKEVRREGNLLFLQSDQERCLKQMGMHNKVMHLYNESIAFAPSGSEELALAYGNKSALLRRMREYKECIVEIDKALKITESITMKIKLLCRKAESLTALGLSENRSCLEKAKFMLTKSNESKKVEKMLNKLIGLTQSTIDAEKLEIPTQIKKMQELSKIASAEKVDVWTSVQVGYNEKYGEHLIAARDFGPGEIVMVKKAYVNHLNETKRFMYCSHCWYYLSTAVPCDSCSLRLFCSEQCKTEAIEQYHDIECSVMLQMVQDPLLNESTIVPLLIRAFARMLKEAGSINQLREDIKYMDECRDLQKRFSPNGGFKDYHAIYNLPICNASEDLPESYMATCVVALIGLAKYSSIFGTTYDLNEIDRLVNDDTAMFASALMLKLILTTCSKCQVIQMLDISECFGDKNVDKIIQNRAQNTQASLSLRSLEYLAVFNCAPNVKSFPSYRDRHVTYAIHPIKKGSPLVASISSIYDKIPKHKRQNAYQISFGRPCDCQACVEDWSDILNDDEKFTASLNANPTIARQLMDEKKLISQQLNAKSGRKFSYERVLPKVQRFVAKAWEHFPMPSKTSFIAINVMTDILENLHT